MSDPQQHGSPALARPPRTRPGHRPPPPRFEDPAELTEPAVPARRAPVPVEHAPAPPVSAPAAPRMIRARAPETAQPRRRSPDRPATTSTIGAPVLTTLPPPFTVRLSQFLWVLSLLVGAVAVVYLFAIRTEQTPLIVDVVKGVVTGRSDEAYRTTADILYWSVFGIALTLLLVQVVLLVSFSTRKPRARWWQLATVAGQVLLYLLSAELVSVGQHGPILRQVLLAQWGIALLALLFSTFRNALQWTARRHDVRRVASSGDGAEF